MMYVYLNKYENGYLYVGIHKWEGKGLDSSYDGSSNIARKYGWAPVEKVILEEGEDLKGRERYWINYYADKYGIADVVYTQLHKSRWLLSKRRGGLMLNGHCNEPPHDHEAMIKARETQRLNNGGAWHKFWEGRTKEGFRRAADKRIENGAQKKALERAHEKAWGPEAQAKRVETAKRNGSMQKAQSAATEAARAPESVRKSMDSRTRNRMKDRRFWFVLVEGESEPVSLDSLRRKNKIASPDVIKLKEILSEDLFLEYKGLKLRRFVG